MLVNIERPKDPEQVLFSLSECEVVWLEEDDNEQAASNSVEETKSLFSSAASAVYNFSISFIIYKADAPSRTPIAPPTRCKLPVTRACTLSCTSFSFSPSFASPLAYPNASSML
jgi:hypothetical protein